MLLECDGFVVLAADVVDGETEPIIETTADWAWCAVRARAKDRSSVLVRDVDAFGRRVRLLGSSAAGSASKTRVQCGRAGREQLTRTAPDPEYFNRPSTSNFARR